MRVAFQRAVAAGLAPIMLAGCYNYVPVDLSTLAPGAEVRARVTQARAKQLEDTLGLDDTRLLNGKLVSQQGGGLTMTVQTSPQGTVGAMSGIFKDVTLVRPDLLEVESVKLDPIRTTIAAGVGATGLVLLTRLLHGQGSTAETSSEQGPNVAKIPLIRFRF